MHSRIREQLLATPLEIVPLPEQDAASYAATLGIPTFASTPDAFPEMIAAALAKRDVGK